MKTSKQCGAVLAVLLGAIILLPSLYAEKAAPTWKKEFERICSQTQVAVSLPSEDLLKLISDSEKLLEELKQSEDPGAKIYVFRLEKCKVFFEYSQELLKDQ